MHAVSSATPLWKTKCLSLRYEFAEKAKRCDLAVRLKEG